jgi:hypothetical protein
LRPSYSPAFESTVKCGDWISIQESRCSARECPEAKRTTKPRQRKIEGLSLSLIMVPMLGKHAPKSRSAFTSVLWTDSPPSPFSLLLDRKFKSGKLLAGDLVDSQCGSGSCRVFYFNRPHSGTANVPLLSLYLYLFCTTQKCIRPGKWSAGRSP